jgi:hypothetical protein
VTSTGVLATANDSSSQKNDMPELGVPCVSGIEGAVGITVAIAPYIHADDSNDNIEGPQNSAASPRDASDSSQPKAGTRRRWFEGAMLWMVEFFAGGLISTSGR